MDNFICYHFSVFNLLIYSCLLTSKNKKISIFIFTKFILVTIFSLSLLFFTNYKDTALLRLLGILIGEIINFLIFGFYVQKFFINQFNVNYFSYFKIGSPLIFED